MLLSPRNRQHILTTYAAHIRSFQPGVAYRCATFEKNAHLTKSRSSTSSYQLPVILKVLFINLFIYLFIYLFTLVHLFLTQ